MSEAKTTSFQFTIGERIAALKIFDSFKGSLSVLSVLLEDVKQFTVSTEEWEQAERKIDKNADGTENWNWNDEKVVKEINLQSESAQFLKDEIKKKSDAGEVTLKDIALVNISKKLEA